MSPAAVLGIRPSPGSADTDTDTALRYDTAHWLKRCLTFTVPLWRGNCKISRRLNYSLMLYRQLLNLRNSSSKAASYAFFQYLATVYFKKKTSKPPNKTQRQKVVNKVKSCLARLQTLSSQLHFSCRREERLQVPSPSVASWCSQELSLWATAGVTVPSWHPPVHFVMTLWGTCQKLKTHRVQLQGLLVLGTQQHLVSGRKKMGLVQLVKLLLLKTCPHRLS